MYVHGVMGRQIDHSWWTHWAISRFSQCPTTGVIKAVVCVILSGMMHIKERVAVMAAAGFLSRYLIASLQYVAI